MQKERIITKILDVGLVAIVRTDTAEKALRIADACLEGGVAALEVAFTTPGTAGVIEELAKRYPGGEILIGAGTVLDPETARIAILSGAQFMVSPALNPDTVKLCNRYRFPIMPGCMTVRDCIDALELGVDVIKLFPSELLGPKAVKAINGPLPQANLMPTGGVSAQNVGEWIEAGAVAVAVGGSLVAPAKTGDYAGVTSYAKLLLDNIQKARASLK